MAQEIIKHFSKQTDIKGIKTVFKTLRPRCFYNHVKHLLLSGNQTYNKTESIVSVRAAENIESKGTVRN